MPTPFTNGAVRADGPPHDLYLGVERTSGPPHDLYLGVIYEEECPADWEELPGLESGVNFATCGELSPDLNQSSFSWENESTGGDGVNFSWRWEGDWYPTQGNDLLVGFECCVAAAPDVIMGLVDAFHGEYSDSSLSLSAQFSLDVYIGATVEATVEAPSAFDIAVEFASDSTLIVDGLSTLPLFAPDFHTGEYSVFSTFDTHPAINLGTTRVYTGENWTASVEKYTFVGADHRTGEYTYADLETEPYEGLQGDAYAGESLTVDVQVTPGFILSIATGERVEFDALATSMLLAPTASTGEYATAIFTDNPPWNPTLDFTDGATFDPFLNAGASSVGSILVYGGETLESSVDTKPGEPIAFTMNEGQTASLAMSFAQNLGATEAYEGITLIPETIEFDELWKMFDGATASISMATSDSMVPSAYDGAYAIATVDTRPSEPLGVFYGYDGATTTLGTIAALKAVFMSVNFADSFMFQAGLPYLGSYFDLDVSCCTDHDPGQQDLHQIELNHAPFPDEHYDGDRVRIDADLSTNIRFSFDFKTGETASNVDTIPYILGVTSAHGEALTVELESIIDFAMCPGNFIPDGDNVFVELDFNDASDCEAHFVYASETMSVASLEANQNFQGDMYTGERMVFTLFVPDEVFGVQFRTGEVFIFPSDIEVSIRSGEYATFTFAVDPIIAAHGETLDAEVVIKYDVRFEEVGCLDNEFIYQDENGDPIPEKFNPVPVELDPYQHDIRALCF